MGIGRAFDAAMDWMMDGHIAWSLTKFLAVSAAAVGLIASPFVYMAHQNAKAFDNRIEMLDASPSVIFNSVSGCVTEGYNQSDCEASQKEALDIANELGTTISYSSGSECRAHHRSCERIETVVTTYNRVGDVMVPITNRYTNYHPPVVAWQAAADNIEEAVPLYQGSRDGIAVRKDGAEFAIPMPR